MLTTEAFVAALVDALVAQGVAVDDAAALKTTLKASFDAWLDAPDALPANIAQKLASTAGYFNAEVLSRYDWWTIPADGGPNGDGTIDLTLADGTVVPVPGRLKLVEQTAKGDPGGVSFSFAEETAAGDPGDGGLRLNDSTPGSATEIYVDDLERGGADVSGWIEAFGAPTGTPKGIWTLLEAATGKLLVFSVTGAPTDAGGYWSVPVAYLAGQGGFAADGHLVTLFAPAGDVTSEAEAARDAAQAARDAIVDVVANEDVPGATLVVEDPNGYAIFIQYNDGTTWSPDLAAVKAQALAAQPAAQSVAIEAWGDVPYVFADSDGYAIAYVDPSGRIRSPAMDADRAELTAVRARVDALDHVDDPGVEMRGGLNYVPVYGQSLSIGVEGGPAISTTPIAWAKRFTSGVRPHEAITGGTTDPAVLYGAVEGLVESTVETICSGAAEVYGALYAARFGATPDQQDQQLLFCCPGEGGQPIDSLDEGTAYFTRLADTVEYGAARAAELDAAYAVPAAMYLQGETDQGNATHPDFYRFLFRGLRDSIAQLAALHADQERAPPILHYQIGQHLMFGSLEPTIALAQLAMAEEAGFALVCPLYPFPFAPDGVHMINTSYRWMGGYFGRALFEWAYDRIKPRRLKPLWAKPQADGVLLAFDVPKPPIVFDTTLVTDPGDYGFELLDAAGDPLSVDVVTRAGPNHVFIRPTTGAIATVRYACRNGLALNTHTGPTSGPRGNLRDSSGDDLTLLVSGVAKPLHHWAPIFQLQVS